MWQISNIFSPYPVNLLRTLCLWRKHFPTKSTLYEDRQSSAPQWYIKKKGHRDLHTFLLGCSQGLLFYTHTAALTKTTKKNLFPPQSEECLSVVSTLPQKHMLWFHFSGCMRGEFKEKSYDHRKPNGWLNM